MFLNNKQLFPLSFLGTTEMARQEGGCDEGANRVLQSLAGSLPSFADAFRCHDDVTVG
jgi:hypothetical protein